MSNIQEHERAVLTRDLPEKGFEAGDVGTVVSIHEDGAGGVAGYTLEFFGLAGETLAIVTVPAEAVGEIREGQVVHARTLREEAAG